jgi:hypothetical protein
MQRKASHEVKQFGLTARFVMGVVAAIMVPPFVVLAIAPMLLILAPVALVAIPFMLSAFAGESRELTVEPRRLAAWRHAHAMN